jgi:hypothetical protein
LSTANPNAEHPFRQEPSSEPIYIEPADHILAYSAARMDPETLRQTGMAFLRLADEKESS